MCEHRMCDVGGILLILKPIAVHDMPLNNQLFSAGQQYVPLRCGRLGVRVQADEYHAAAFVRATKPVMSRLFSSRTAERCFDGRSIAREFPAMVAAPNAVRFYEAVSKRCPAVGAVFRDESELAIS